MAFHVLGLISNLYKPQPRHKIGGAHLMLSGINQEIFLRHWGTPEININFDDLQEIFRLDFLPLNSDSPENETLAAWIYEKMDIFVIFRKGKLIAHFKWSEFRERFKRSKMKVDLEGNKKPPALAITTLSLFS